MATPRYAIRTATASEWESWNGVLGEGERARETDTDRYKIGDGTTQYNDLPYTHGGVVVVDNILMAEVDDL